MVGEKELLMEYPGTSCARPKSWTTSGPENPDRRGNNVELYISYLRRKTNAAGPPSSTPCVASA